MILVLKGTVYIVKLIGVHMKNIIIIANIFLAICTIYFTFKESLNFSFSPASIFSWALIASAIAITASLSLFMVKYITEPGYSDGIKDGVKCWHQAALETKFYQAIFFSLLFLSCSAWVLFF